MTADLFSQTPLTEVFNALKSDLIQEDGPRISTMRNYRFAIVPYDPKDEFALRREVRKLHTDLVSSGWMVLSINLQKLLLDRVRSQGEDFVRRLIEREKRTAGRSIDRAIQDLQTRLSPLIEGPDGIAADCSRLICSYAEEHPEAIDRTVAIIGRAGALYPFLRSSALLRHLDGRTQNVPVVLLYPGERRGDKGLSFMGQVDPDSDYRPRIY
ncbi:MAG: DUF1788 domain-containing protein [Planctomycetaceae bacterium]